MGLTGQVLLQTLDNLLIAYRDQAAAAHQNGNREIAKQIAVRFKALKALRDKVAEDPSVDIDPSRLPPANPMDLFVQSPKPLTRALSLSSSTPSISSSAKSVRSMVRLQEAIMLENRRDPYNHMITKELRKNTREALRDVGTTIRDIQRLVAASESAADKETTVVPEPRDLMEVLTTSQREPLESFIRGLREDATVLVGGLDVRYFTSNKTNTNLARTIIFSLFQNCFAPGEQTLVLRVLREAIRTQIAAARNTKVGQKFFKPFLEDLLSNYLLYTGTFQYLRETLRESLEEILDHPSLVLSPVEPAAQKLAGYPSIVPVETARANRDYYVRSIYDIILESVQLMPYGLRWLAKQIHCIALEYLQADRVSSLLFEYLFDLLYIPTILNPSRIGADTGARLRPGQRNNLQEVTKELTRICTTDEVPEAFYESVRQVEDLDEYFGFLGDSMTTKRQHNQLTITLTKEECPLLLHLAPNVISEALWAEISAALPPSFIVRVSKSQEAVNRKSIVHQDPTEAKIIISTKKTLREVLGMYRLFGGYTSKSTVMSLLQSQYSATLNWESKTVVDRTENVFKLLRSLPEAYQANDFTLLLEEMLAEHAEKKEAEINEVDGLIVYLEQVYEHLSFLRKLRDGYTLLTVRGKIRALTEEKKAQAEPEQRARSQTQSPNMEEFAETLRVFPARSVCTCDPAFPDPVFCQPCLDKSRLVRSHIEHMNGWIAASQAFSEAELPFAQEMLEGEFLSNLYDILHPANRADLRLIRGIEACPDFDVNFFKVPFKYRSTLLFFS